MVNTGTQKLAIEYVGITDLSPAPFNPRRIAERRTASRQEAGGQSPD